MAKEKKPKKKELGGKIPTLDKQILDDDTITIEEVRQFIADAKKKAEDYYSLADRSWREIERRDKSGKIYSESTVTLAKRWAKFPLWWSVWKIRQPITLARMPIPTLKDTQGDDPYGRTACVVGERFTRGILKTFEAFPEVAASNDDFLVTNFGWARAFYRNELCQEEERIYLQVVMPEPPIQNEGDPAIEQAPPMPPRFFLPTGQELTDPSQILKDDMGHYVLTGNEISVDNEEVYLEAGLYNNLIVDPDVTKWNKVTRLAYEYKYSYREFKDKYGQEALDTLVQADLEKHKTGTPITVYEYWDKQLKEVRWLAETSTDFFQPKEIRGLSDKVDHSDLYGLTGFFPSTEPLIINQSTKCFWPTPEYYQVCDILDDISAIVGRMVHLTKAIRVRFLFDSSVTDLKTLIGDNWAANEGSGIGVGNLQAALMNDKNADLSKLVAYFPVDKLIEGLNNMYIAFDQRLNMFYQITGISDLIRGQTNPDSDKTYGERQMEGKFALNRIEPFQRKLQEWIKDQYQLLMEMGLKMFSDQTIDKYVTPQTLDPEDRERYISALALLRDNKKRRFRVDFETDSTIAINEQWRRGQAIETANVITKMQEAVANTAETMPELVESQLKIMSHVIGELTDGKLFLDEIQDSIKQVIEKVNQPKDEPPNVELLKYKLEERKQGFEEQRAVNTDRFEQMKTELEANIEISKNNQKAQYDQLSSQIEQFKISIDNQTKQAKIAADAQASRENLEKEYQKISADLMTSREELALQAQELMIKVKEMVDKKELTSFQVMLDARSQQHDQKLGELQQQLEAARLKIEARDSEVSLAERIATEQRLQAEQLDDKITKQLDALNLTMDLALKKKELDAPLETKEEAKPAKKKKKKSKVVRDKNGDIAEIIQEEID